VVVIVYFYLFHNEERNDTHHQYYSYPFFLLEREGLKMNTVFFKKSLKIPKRVIRIRISKKNRQHNDQKKKDKKTNIHIKLKIE